MTSWPQSGATKRRPPGIWREIPQAWSTGTNGSRARHVGGDRRQEALPGALALAAVVAPRQLRGPGRVGGEDLRRVQQPPDDAGPGLAPGRGPDDGPRPPPLRMTRRG